MERVSYKSAHKHRPCVSYHKACEKSSVIIYLELIQQVIIVVLASLGLGFALAVGLGAKGVVEDYLRQLIKESKEEEKEETK